MSNEAHGTLSHVLIYTDGACSGNPGRGGFAAVIRWMSDEGEEVSRLTVTGADPETTNARMEMMAAIAALDALGETSGAAIEVWSDSQMLIKGATEWLPGWIERGWRRADKKPVANRDLWERIAAHIEAKEIWWKWVKGHANDPMNVDVDGLAREAIEQKDGVRE